MSRHAERPLLDRDEQEFVERLGASYAPASLSASRRAALDAALRARLEAPRRWGLLVPALATAAVAALLWVGLAPSLGPGPSGGAQRSAAAWEDELFFSSAVSVSGDRDEADVLPADYQAIAIAFLGDW